jgi:hypothetical protein
MSTTARPRLRLDPWSVDYDAAIQLGSPGEEPCPEVDLKVEVGTWHSVRPLPAASPAHVFFVDGVRRIEHRLLVEKGGQTLFGLLGSFAVGAVDAWHGARVCREQVARIVCVGGGCLVDPFRARLATGPGAVLFEPEAVPENTPLAPLQGLQGAMRRREAELAQQLAAEADLVLLDGPLTFAATGGPVVGFVKRQLRSYLPAGEAGLLERLATFERTPVFLIKDARHPRYSWYARIASGRTIESRLTGIVRLEAPAALGLERVRALADATASFLPRFASDAAHDPRAPHNLHPIGALESRLRHRLGDPDVIRRAIEALLHEEAVA